MNSRTILSALAVLTAPLALGAGNWRLDASFDYSFPAAVGLFHDYEIKMGGDTTGPGNAYGWGAFTGGYGVPSPINLSFDTTPFFDFLGRDPAQPVLEEAFLFGVMDELPGDPAGQQHLVLFTSPQAASRMESNTYTSFFGTSAQPFQYTEEDVILALEKVHDGTLSDDDRKPYRTIVENFRDEVAPNSNVGLNGTLGSAYFNPTDGFSVVIFSNGLTVGSGTAAFTTAFTPVPEPAAFVPLGFGFVALLRRRRR